MTTWWARWRLKSPASWLFTQPFIQAAGQRKHQISASLAFVRGIHRWPVNSPHKWPVTRKMFPFDDVTMAKPEVGNKPCQKAIAVRTTSMIAYHKWMVTIIIMLLCTYDECWYGTFVTLGKSSPTKRVLKGYSLFVIRPPYKTYCLDVFVAM